MSLLVVYNTCGFGGTENSEVYIRNLRSIVDQDLEDKKVVFSGVGSKPETIRAIKAEFGNEISYYFANGS